ncbi:hypothetical protein P879_11990 [Paragonimus westermani]|uniref:Transmembrane protein 138 n=1 Tax=Paragonimus westermani TaxID=34504 RepID=A0A8T0D4P6_9TREM|nr:hypothetical protein P879_11990 [Paragonimus westermani]
MQLLRYQILFVAQLLFLFYDIFANALSENFSTLNVHLLVIYALQDLFLIIMLIILCLEFASTFAFQAGRPVIIFSKFKGSVVTITIYFLACITTHIWGLSLRWENSVIFPSSPGYLVVHFSQRTCESSCSHKHL